MIEGDTYLVTPGEEILKASMTLRRLAVKATGQDWRVVTRRGPGDESAVGVATEEDHLVAGDHDACRDGKVATEDAEYLSAADPGTTLLLADMLHVASRYADASPHLDAIVELALKTSRRINDKFNCPIQICRKSLGS